MIFIIRLILISITCFVAGLFYPWWSIILCTVIVSFFMPGNNFNAFLSGLLGVGLLWLIMAWKVDISVNSIISSKIVQLFPPIDDTMTLVIATGILGGITGGLSAFTGNSFRQIFMRKKKKSIYE